MVIGEAIGRADVAIIGAGPGGYVAAIRAAQLGKQVTLIDRESVGGVCLHHGCIPTKALIRAAEIYQKVLMAKEMGISAENIKVDFSKVQAWKRGIVQKLDEGIRALLKHHKVQLIHANAFFEESNKLALRPVDEKGKEGEHMDINALEFRKCIIATGSKEREIPGITIDGKRIITSYHAIELSQLPRSVLVIGGGYIGVELSQMFTKLGVKVTIVESLPTILALLDEDCSSLVTKRLTEQGATIYCNAKVESSVAQGDLVSTTVIGSDGKKQTIKTEYAIVAIGRVADTSSLSLQNTKVKLDAKGFIQVTNRMQTTDDRIFAIGDAIGGAMLAHKASYEGKVAAEVIAGKKSAFDNLIPYAIFSDPEIAAVGLTEKDAKQRGIACTVKKFKFSGLGKASILGNTDGFFKLLYDDKKNILGIHIAGVRAADMIGEAVLAMEMGATVEDLTLVIHPHPTLIEGLEEAADMGVGLPTNTL